MLLFSARHHFFHAPVGSTVDEKEAVLLRGPGNGGYGSEEAANTGGKGRVVMRGILSHTIHFMCYFDSLRYSCFSRKYQGHQIPWRAKQSHNTNTGEMSHLLQQLTKGRWAPAVSSSLLLSWPSPSCPGHGCLISSSSGGDTSMQARAGAGGAGHFPGTASVIHYPPLKQHIRHSCSAAAITNVS